MLYSKISSQIFTTVQIKLISFAIYLHNTNNNNNNYKFTNSHLNEYIIHNIVVSQLNEKVTKIKFLAF